MANHCDTIKLEKGMYQEAGRSFTQVLERLDPSEQYKGTGMEGLDAFQRQLKRFDIKVRGAASDPVEKFFRTADSAVLFPEYIARSVRQGMEEGDLLPSITAATTRFEGMDYRSITAQAGGDSKELKAVDEGASIPATTIQVQANLVKLRKRGRMLVASYEAVRYQKLDLFSVTLRQIGSHIAQMLLADAVEVLIHGDGNDNAAAASETKGAGVLTYDELVDFWAAFDPYEMNTLLVSSDVLLKMLKLAEFQNPLTGLNFQGTGKLSTPLGATLLRHPAAHLRAAQKHRHRPGQAVCPGAGAGQRCDGGVRQADRPAAGACGHHHHQRLCQAVPRGLPRADGEGVVTGRIQALVRTLGGGTDQEELLVMLCQAAETELAGRLRPGLTPEDCESAFVPAAAWMVLAWLQAGEAGVASFTAGNLTIHRTGQGAAELTAQAERLMAPYLVDGGFSFQGVAG